MKLQSMTDFVLEQNEILGTFENFRKIVYNYANFLKQPLTLGMFVPCDEDCNVLEEPLHIFSDHTEKEKSIMYQSNYLTIKYQKAKDRCLFEGFKFQDANEDNPMPFIYLNEDVTLYPEIWIKEDTIEALLYYNDFIELTQTAIKELGL